MSTSRTTPIHPLAVQDQSRIDILYGGTESAVLRESVALTRDLLKLSPEANEHVLYINTLISAMAFEPHARRATKDIPQSRRFHSITLLQHSLANRLEFLRKTIEELGVRYLILNGFEFATLTSRHRIEIFFWLKSLRDELNLRVIIFTQSGPRKYGTLGQMRFVSRTCAEVGEYIRVEEERQAAEAAEEAEARAAEEKAKADEEERVRQEEQLKADEEWRLKRAEERAAEEKRYAETKLQWEQQKEESVRRGNARRAAARA